MVVPKPGSPVRGSSTGRPVMALLDLLGQRWILRVVWELRDGPLTFRALQDRCDDISPTTLNNRLKALREAQLVELSTDGYRRTALGDELGEQMTALTIWAERWSDELKNDQHGDAS